MTDLGRALIESLTADLAEIHGQAVEATGRISRGLFDVWPFAAATEEKPASESSNEPAKAA